MSTGDILVVAVIGWLVLVGFVVITLIQVRRQHLATNSRLDALLEVTGRLARLEGYEAGRTAEFDRLKDLTGRLEDGPPRDG